MGHREYVASQQECGCKITQTHWPDTTALDIDFCPRHASADALYTASIWALAYLQQGCDGPKDNDYYYTVDMLKAVLADAGNDEIHQTS